MSISRLASGDALIALGFADGKGPGTAPAASRQIHALKGEDQVTVGSAFGSCAADESLRAFQDVLTKLKLDFLLWGWNWTCPEMVREYIRERHQPSRGFRSHPERWEVSHWAQVLGRCAGEEEYLLFEADNVKVSKEEETSYSELFKVGRHPKNGL